MAVYVYAGAAPVVVKGGGGASGGLFRMDVNGGEWRELSAGLPNNVEARAISIAPSDPNTVYVGTQAGPYRSADAGDSWEAMPLPGNEKLVWSILIHPTDPKTLYVGTQGTTMYRSRDGGASWKEITPPEPAGMVKMGFPCRVIRLSLDPTNPDHLWSALEVGGLLRSRDGGDSWESCNAGLLKFTDDPRLRSKIVSDTETEGMMDSHAMAVSAVEPDTVFLANRMGLFRSGDGGMAWDEMGIAKFSPLTYARDVRVSAHDPKRMYAALSVAAICDEGSLYRSEDLGATWKRFDHGVSIDSTLMTVAESAATPDRVWCAARRGQVFGTQDGGKTWNQYMLPPKGAGVYALAVG